MFSEEWSNRVLLKSTTTSLLLPALSDYCLDTILKAGLVHLLSVWWIIFAHNCSVISNVVWTGFWSTVKSQHCKQQWTEHTALRNTNVQCGGAGGRVADPDRLGFPSQKVQSPVAKGGVQTQQAQLCDHFLRNDCVVCYTDVYVQYVLSFLFKLFREGCMVINMVSSVERLRW